MKLYLNEAKTSGHTVTQLRCDGGGEFDSEKPFSQSKKQDDTIINLPTLINVDKPNSADQPSKQIDQCDQEDQEFTDDESSSAEEAVNRHHSNYDTDGSQRVIGTTAYAKMDKKAIKCILVGYDEDDGYRLFNLATNQLIRSRDVVFQEKPFSQSKKQDDTIINLPTLINVDKPNSADQPKTETKKKGRGELILEEGHLLIYSGVPRDKRVAAGIDCLIRQELVKQIPNWEACIERILKMERKTATES
ncbi:hypothetical protein CBL_09595 [Carabus blaptoides fortunei]